MNQRSVAWREQVEAWAARVTRPALLLYLVALAAVLGYGLLAGFRASPRLLDADELEYWDMASGLMGHTLALTARRTLGFPLVLAAIRSVRDDILFVEIVVAALYALTPPLLHLLVRRLGGSRAAALLAGGVLALWPPAVFFGASLYSETLAAPIFVGALALLPRPGDGAGRGWVWRTIAAGALLGLATHVRPMYLLYMPVLALTLLIEARARAAGWRALLLALLGYALVVGPWSAFMTARFGHPILVTANGGETLAGGLNPGLLAPPPAQAARTPDGRAAWVGPGKWVAIPDTGYLTPAEYWLPYDAKDRLLRARTRAWIVGHPGDAAYLEACKLGYMWGLVGIGRNTAKQLLFGNLPTLALLVLALGCAVAGPRGRWRLARLWLLPLFVSGVALISWGSWRFRQPGDVGLIGFCAVCLLRRRDYPADGAGSAR